ncbi:mucin-7-like [Labrus mixtus]|uniref:mucin-7-like n=1 Tax=Labrus mixtus TaxID=508554 RepID=UPI0029C07ABF|nr:mucin-7-like [Labrus mixtus]
MLNSRDVKDYLSHHHLPQLLESLLTGLLYHHPEDPISFLHSCLTTTRHLGGPRAVTWDTFIHLERHRPSQGPPWTTCVPPKAQFVITSTPPPRTTSEPLNTTSVAPKTTFVSITTPEILQTTSQITPLTPLITLKTSIPPIKTHKTPTLLQTSALKPVTEPPKPQNIPPKPSKTSPTPRVIPPIPPTSITAPPRHSGSQTTSIKPIITFLTPLTPLVSSISNKTPKTASEQYAKLLPPAPPGPAVIPPPNLTETKEEWNKNTDNPEGPPPSPVLSQLSIDSDSDMTESSGLQQEVSIKLSQRQCPIIFIIGGPGSGKGNQAALLAKSFNLRVISLDELLRRQLLSQASPSRKWEVISQMMSHAEMGSQVRVNNIYHAASTINHQPSTLHRPWTIFCD